MWVFVCKEDAVESVPAADVEQTLTAGEIDVLCRALHPSKQGADLKLCDYFACPVILADYVA